MGFAPAHESAQGERYARWVGEGMHGEMAYLAPSHSLRSAGAVEQVGMPYPDCAAGLKHPPYWGDVIIRRADTLQPATSLQPFFTGLGFDPDDFHMSLDHLSGGRFILGLGTSNPQVVEGWYGELYPRPRERTRE